MYSSWVFQVVITMCPNLSAVSLSGTICWETMHYMWASTVKKKKQNLTSKKKKEKGSNNRTKQLCKKTGCTSLCVIMPTACRFTDLTTTTLLHRLIHACVCVLKHTRVCFCDTTVTLDTFVSMKLTYKTISSCSESRAISTNSLQMNVLIVRSFKWKQRVGLRYTICPKCLCKGYALGLSHSLLHDCSLHLRFHFALWYRKPCIEACSSAASLQRPHWGRDPERCMVHEQKPHK